MGRGAALKPQVGYMVAQLLGLSAPPRPADAADGVAVALTHLMIATILRTGPAPEAPTMIATVAGTLADRDGETILVETEGGVGYAVTVTLGALERLPGAGKPGAASTPSWWSGRTAGPLFGFDGPATVDLSAAARRQRVRTPAGAGGVSTLGPARAVRSIQQKDIAALATVRGIGRKKAERLVVELQDRFGGLEPEAGAPTRGTARRGGGRGRWRRSDTRRRRPTKRSAATLAGGPGGRRGRPDPAGAPAAHPPARMDAE